MNNKHIIVKPFCAMYSYALKMLQKKGHRCRKLFSAGKESEVILECFPGGQVMQTVREINDNVLHFLSLEGRGEHTLSLPTFSTGDFNPRITPFPQSLSIREGLSPHLDIFKLLQVSQLEDKIHVTAYCLYSQFPSCIAILKVCYYQLQGL